MSDTNRGHGTATATIPPAEPEIPAGAEHAGLAHVATASFLASRVVPTGGFGVALAGGIALARAAQIAGTRVGYGASLAAMLQAVAVIGPSRIGVPLTQALSAPMLGCLHTRRISLAVQFAACAAIRALDQIVTAGFYIWIIVGGVDAYAATYDALVGRIPGVPDGPAAALVATAVALVAWTAFASAVQVLVYRAALRRWPPDSLHRSAGAPVAAPEPPPALHPRYDPRAVALAATFAFVVLVSTTAWPVLAAVSVWLALSWATARGDRSPVRAGAALAALLAAGALIFGLVGGVDLDLTLQRTVRAALLVLVATWLRAAAGEQGLREVARRSLRRVRGGATIGEASAIFERLGASGGLAGSGRALVDAVRHVPRRPSLLAAAVVGWIASESARFEAPAPAVPVALRMRAADWLLIALLAVGTIASRLM